jgi:hypothetical protein
MRGSRLAVNDNTPDEARYQALAADAFAAADHMRDPDAQLVMRKIARGYLRLARLVEKRHGPSRHYWHTG